MRGSPGIPSARVPSAQRRIELHRTGQSRPCMMQWNTPDSSHKTAPVVEQIEQSSCERGMAIPCEGGRSRNHVPTLLHAHMFCRDARFLLGRCQPIQPYMHLSRIPTTNNQQPTPEDKSSNHYPARRTVNGMDASFHTQNCAYGLPQHHHQAAPHVLCTHDRQQCCQSIGQQVQVRIRLL